MKFLFRVMFLFSLTWVACGADLNTRTLTDQSRFLETVYKEFPNYELYQDPIRGELQGGASHFDELIHVALGWKPMAFVPCNKKNPCSTYEELERANNCNFAKVLISFTRPLCSNKTIIAAFSNNGIFTNIELSKYSFSNSSS